MKETWQSKVGKHGRRKSRGKWAVQRNWEKELKGEQRQRDTGEKVRSGRERREKGSDSWRWL